MTLYAKLFSKKTTHQSVKAHPEQHLNHAGGYAFLVSDWARLDRFLILGNEGGTYYASERTLTLENARAVVRCLDRDGQRVVERVVEISKLGRAPKNDPAIFVLALAAAHDTLEVRKAALQALPEVCRTGTHLFQFADSVRQFRGWGRALRQSIADWYNDKSEDAVAYQVVKYRERHGWSHRDLMRLAHPGPKHAALYRWLVGAESGVRQVRRGDRSVSYAEVPRLPKFVEAYEALKRAGHVSEVAELIRQHGLTHEMVPTEFKNSVDVWAALLERMPLTAMLRNLGKMTQVGLIAPGSAASKHVIQRLSDKQALKRARVHPLSLLLALGVYQNGKGVRGSLSWTPDGRVVDALDAAFYLAFEAIEPTGKRVLLALDVSGSMQGGCVAGAPGITPMLASAAMALVTARTENDWQMVGFSSGSAGEWVPRGPRQHRYGWGTGISALDISPRQRLDDVVKSMSKVPMGATDCALPMLYATDRKLEVDAFCVYTDNETWSGDVHPFQALEQYRQRSGIGAKLIVVGMTATEFSIANPDDAGMLDVVGFDTAAPAVMADFIRA